ncbi:MAG: ABC transporter permease [Phycisphaerae bacterium]|nr:ABC transporter permease [Phycisphaerae bacterium]
MFKFIIRRILISIPLLFGVTVLSFLLINLAPGGQMALPGSEMNPGFNPHVREMMNREFHFNEPLYKQYYFMMRDMFTGKLASFKDQQSALKKVIERVPATLALSAMAIFISFSAAIPLGIFAAQRKGQWQDTAVGILSFALVSLPTFWVAYMLILFVLRVVHMPVLGTETYGVEFSNTFTWLLDRTWHVFLPAVTLALAGIAWQSRYMRASMVETMNEEYIRTARAKGLPESRVAYKHALRNSLRPIVTFVGFLLPAFLSGSVIIEQIFAYPGMGRLTFQALLERDMPVIMVSLTIGSVLLIAGNILADILYAIVDPRVRLN